LQERLKGRIASRGRIDQFNDAISLKLASKAEELGAKGEKWKQRNRFWEQNQKYREEIFTLDA
jgi:hypothetical protein